VFFVIKIERIRTRGGDESDARVATYLAPSPGHYPLEPHSNFSPDLLEGTTSQFAQGNLSSGKPLGPSGILTHSVGVHARSCYPIIAPFLAKIPSFLPGSGRRIKIVVTYRKQREAHLSTRGQNIPLAAIKSTHILTSNKLTNRASCESSTGQNPPMGSPKPTRLVPESHHV
jgi:hypothetical protein